MKGVCWWYLSIKEENTCEFCREHEQEKASSVHLSRPQSRLGFLKVLTEVSISYSCGFL